MKKGVYAMWPVYAHVCVRACVCAQRFRCWWLNTRLTVGTHLRSILSFDSYLLFVRISYRVRGNTVPRNRRVCKWYKRGTGLPNLAYRDSLIVSRLQDFISHGPSYFVLQSVPRFISVEFIVIQKYCVSMYFCLSNYNRSIYRGTLHIISRMNSCRFLFTVCRELCIKLKIHYSCKSNQLTA